MCRVCRVCRVCRLDLLDAPVGLRSLLLMIRKQLERLPQQRQIALLERQSYIEREPTMGCTEGAWLA